MRRKANSVGKKASRPKMKLGPPDHRLVLFRAPPILQQDRATLTVSPLYAE